MRRATKKISIRQPCLETMMMTRHSATDPLALRVCSVDCRDSCGVRDVCMEHVRCGRVRLFVRISCDLSDLC